MILSRMRPRRSRRLRVETLPLGTRCNTGSRLRAEWRSPRIWICRTSSTSKPLSRLRRNRNISWVSFLAASGLRVAGVPETDCFFRRSLPACMRMYLALVRGAIDAPEAIMRLITKLSRCSAERAGQQVHGFGASPNNAAVRSVLMAARHSARRTQARNGRISHE